MRCVLATGWAVGRMARIQGDGTVCLGRHLPSEPERLRSIPWPPTSHLAQDASATSSDPDSVNHHFIKAALPHLVPLLLEQLTKQEEGQETDDGVWNVSMVRWAEWLLLSCWALVVATAVDCKQFGTCLACHVIHRWWPPYSTWPPLPCLSAGCRHVPSAVRLGGGRCHRGAGHAVCDRQHPEDGWGGELAPAGGRHLCLWLHPGGAGEAAEWTGLLIGAAEQPVGLSVCLSGSSMHQAPSVSKL